MKISVIVPVYNGEDFLEKCINSILNQTYSDIEIIIVDDGSTDKTPQICDEMEGKHSNIRVLHQKNAGQASARNAGVRIAAGEYVGFVDADDTIAQDMYESLCKHVDRNKKQVVIIDAYTVFEDGRIEDYPCRMPNGEITAIDYMRLLLLHVGHASLWVGLYKREQYMQHPLVEGKLNEDFLFWVELLQNIDTVYGIDEKKYNYHVRGGSTTRSGFNKAIIDMVDNTWIVKKLVEEKYPELMEEMIRFFLYQRMYYVLVAPKELFKEDSHCRKVVDDIKGLKKNIITNKYLTIKQKVALIMICINPIMFKKFVGLVKKES